MFEPIVFQQGGIRATLLNTFMAQLMLNMLIERLQLPDYYPAKQGEIALDVYSVAAAYSRDVSGIDWTPPAPSASERELVANFEQFMREVPVPVGLAWRNAVLDMLAPIAPAEQVNPENPTSARSSNGQTSTSPT
jgi:hypothetical protein